MTTSPKQTYGRVTSTTQTVTRETVVQLFNAPDIGSEENGDLIPTHVTVTEETTTSDHGATLRELRIIFRGTQGAIVCFLPHTFSDDVPKADNLPDEVRRVIINEARVTLAPEAYRKDATIKRSQLNVAWARAVERVQETRTYDEGEAIYCLATHMQLHNASSHANSAQQAAVAAREAGQDPLAAALDVYGITVIEDTEPDTSGASA